MMYSLRSLTITAYLIFATFFVAAQQDMQDYDQQDDNIAYYELVFDIGMNLAQQKQIEDMSSLQEALSEVYQQVDQVAQIVDVYMMMDEDLAHQNISSVAELIDYEIGGDEVLAQAMVAWLSAYQTLFFVFTAIHQPQDHTFEVWYDDIQFLGSLTDDELPEDVAYRALLCAVQIFYEAQADFEAALHSEK